MFDIEQAKLDLVQTINYLADHKWIQGRNWDRHGGCCAFGALLMVASESGRRPLAEHNRSSDVCRVFYRVVGEDLTGYNDTPGRTKSEVLAKLREVLDVLNTDPDRAMGKQPSRG